MKKIILAYILIFIVIGCGTMDDDIYLESQFKGAMLVGKVITEEGLPLETVKVRLDSFNETKTDISGRFFFKYILYGNYSMTFEKDGFLTEEFKFSHSYKNRKKLPFIKIKLQSFNHLANEGFEFLKERKYNETKDIIDKLEKIAPSEEIVLYLKAVYAFKLDKFGEALPLLESLKLRDRKNVFYQLTLLNVYDKLEMHEKKAELAYYIGISNPHDYYQYLKVAADTYKEKLNNDKEYEKAMNEYNKYFKRYNEKK